MLTIGELLATTRKLTTAQGPCTNSAQRGISMIRRYFTIAAATVLSFIGLGVAATEAFAGNITSRP